MSTVVANRYARALADVLAKKVDYRAALKELQGFAAVYGASWELREVLKTPAVPFEQKTKVLEAVLARLKASTVTRNFLRALLANYRMVLLEKVVEGFRRVANARMGIAEVRVSSAARLSPAEEEALRAAFRKLTRQEVELEFQLDDSLLGGVRAQIDSTVYDGTVRGQLERIREELTAR